MAGKKKPVKIHYRRFDVSFMPDARTLEDLIHEAMLTRVSGAAISSRFSHRLYSSGEDNYFVNIFEKKSGEMDVAFGDVLHFTQGHMQALFKAVSDDAEKVEVNQMPAPERAEYVHSQMFWFVKGNNVFILQSQSLKTETLEEYFSWLLHKQSKVLSPEVPIVLAAKFNPGVVGGDVEDIQEIIVGGVVARPPEPEVAGAREKNDAPLSESLQSQNNNVTFGGSSGKDAVMGVLKELFGGDAVVHSALKDLPPDVDLKVHVHIGYQTRKRGVDRLALKNMEVGLRNIPDSQIQVKAKGQIVGFDGASRLHHSDNISYLRVDERTGSLLDPSDVLRAMVSGYTQFLTHGKIPA